MGALLLQAIVVFDAATTLDTAMDRLDPQPPLVERLVGQVLRQGPFLTAWLLGRHEELQHAVTYLIRLPWTRFACLEKAC